LIGELVDPGRPPHVGVLLENVPEYLFWAGGAALAGAAIVGINPTRRGGELARDIRHTDCQLIVTDKSQSGPLEGLDLGRAHDRVLVLDTPAYVAALAAVAGAALPHDDVDGDAILFLLFTSGSTGAPKAVVCSTGRMAGAGARAGAFYGVTRDEVCYCPMPLFHGNALMANWAPALNAGATVALRRKFSASGFLDDVRRFGATYFTYVGRALAYVLAQPPTPHDRDNRLRLGFGTEASALDRQRFTERFGCPLVESYGSSESVISIMRTPETPPQALGLPRDTPGSDVAVVDPATGEERPRARFDVAGALVNGTEAIGEIVERGGAGAFEGYYDNAEATRERMRHGWYWTGDLGYRDEAGFFYFAGRSADWLRVDSENFAAAPVERILQRLPDAVMVAVYPVPDPRTGDQVMAAVELHAGTKFDADAFGAFLDAQPDLGTKWAPRLVRIVAEMPLTANAKLFKPGLRRERWETDDPVWFRPPGDEHYRLMTAADRDALTREFAASGRTGLL
jgi:fatty-acyl-CoA synthase